MVVEAGERVPVGEVPGRVVEARVAERHGGLVDHRPGQVEVASLHPQGLDEGELDEADRLALGHQRQHHERAVAFPSQERDLGGVGGRVLRVERRHHLRLQHPPGLREARQVEERIDAGEPLRRPDSLRREAARGAIPERDRALVGPEGAADVLGDQVGHAARIEAAREGAAHVGDVPEVIGEGARGPHGPRRLHRGGGLVGENREHPDVRVVELAQAELREGDDAGDALVVAHGDDDHRLVDIVGAGDRLAARVRAGVGHQERPAVRGDPAGEPLADLLVEVAEGDLPVDRVAGRGDRNEVVRFAGARRRGRRGTRRSPGSRRPRRRRRQPRRGAPPSGTPPAGRPPAGRPSAPWTPGRSSTCVRARSSSAATRSISSWPRVRRTTTRRRI